MSVCHIYVMLWSWIYQVRGAFGRYCVCASVEGHTKASLTQCWRKIHVLCTGHYAGNRNPSSTTFLTRLYIADSKFIWNYRIFHLMKAKGIMFYFMPSCPFLWSTCFLKRQPGLYTVVNGVVSCVPGVCGNWPESSLSIWRVTPDLIARQQLVL